MRVLSRQMQQMQAKLHVFTDYDVEEDAAAKELCRLEYPHVEVHYFDSLSLLEEAGYPVEAMSERWPMSDTFAQSSDILRILLARKYRYTYIDFDIYFVETGDVGIYSEAFMGAGIVKTPFGKFSFHYWFVFV